MADEHLVPPSQRKPKWGIFGVIDSANKVQNQERYRQLAENVRSKEKGVGDPDLDWTGFNDMFYGMTYSLPVMELQEGLMVGQPGLQIGFDTFARAKYFTDSMNGLFEGDEKVHFSLNMDRETGEVTVNTNLDFEGLCHLGRIGEALFRDQFEPIVGYPAIEDYAQRTFQHIVDDGSWKRMPPRMEQAIEAATNEGQFRDALDLSDASVEKLREAREAGHKLPKETVALLDTPGAIDNARATRSQNMLMTSPPQLTIIGSSIYGVRSHPYLKQADLGFMKSRPERNHGPTCSRGIRFSFARLESGKTNGAVNKQISGARTLVDAWHNLGLMKRIKGLKSFFPGYAEGKVKNLDPDLTDLQDSVEKGAWGFLKGLSFDAVKAGFIFAKDMVTKGYPDHSARVVGWKMQELEKENNPDADKPARDSAPANDTLRTSIQDSIQMARRKLEPEVAAKERAKNAIQGQLDRGNVIMGKYTETPTYRDKRDTTITPSGQKGSLSDVRHDNPKRAPEGKL